MRPSVDTREVIHLPDLQFIQYCQQRYGLNRGVYNTIDSWFYNMGVTDIAHRRNNIIQFLDGCSQQIQHGKLQFGHGGLTPCLTLYWNTITKYE